MAVRHIKLQSRLSKNIYFSHNFLAIWETTRKSVYVNVYLFSADDQSPE